MFGEENVDNPGLTGLSYTVTGENGGALNYVRLSNQSELKDLTLKGCPELTTLYCIGTKIKSFSQCEMPNLQYLDCINNSEMTSLNLGSYPELIMLTATNNSSLVSLDLSKNNYLDKLFCYDNESLSTLTLPDSDSSPLAELICSNTKVNNLANLRKYQGLKVVNCNGTEVPDLDLTGLKNLESVNCNNCKNLKHLHLKGCTNLTYLNYSDCETLELLDVTGCQKLDKGFIKPMSGLTILEDKPVETKYDYTVKGIEDSYWQTGSAIEPKPVLKYGTYTLKEGKDYTLSYKNNVDGPKGSVIIKGKGVYGGVNKTVTFKIEKTDRMNRLYNPNSGEHFYTASTAEKNHLVKLGWRAEGIGWTSPKTSKTPVYRLYNPNAGDHHYTMSSQEKDMLVSKGWRYEGIAFYSGDSDGVAVYRQYNPNAKAGAHNYTPSFAEHNYLVNVGWHGEGVAWYGVSND